MYVLSGVKFWILFVSLKSNISASKYASLWKNRGHIAGVVLNGYRNHVPLFASPTAGFCFAVHFFPRSVHESKQQIS
jgi:hypothetical protein